MKKIKLNTSALRLKKDEISNLSMGEMKQVMGGDTGPCTTGTCPSDTCGSEGFACIPTQGCPTPSPNTASCVAGECMVSADTKSCHHC
jgi:hypothetical protein